MKKIFLLFSLSLAASPFVHAQHRQAHDAMEKKYGEPGMEKAQAWLDNMMNAKTDDAYDFPLLLNMHVTSYKKSKGEEVDITYYINTSKGNFAVTGMGEGKRNKDNMLMVYDVKNNSMLMLNQDDKTGMAININAFMSGEQIKKREQGMNGGGEKGTSDVNCKKTGKTKTIQGYSCNQYVCTDEDRNTRSEIWVTNKIPVDIAKSGSKGPWAMYFANMQGLGGMMMEGDFYKNDKLDAKMEVTKIDPNVNMNVKVSDYKMGMGMR